MSSLNKSASSFSEESIFFSILIYDRAYFSAREIDDFDNEEDAFLAYKKEKENIIHELAIEYKDELPTNIFDMLISWEFKYGGEF